MEIPSLVSSVLASRPTLPLEMCDHDRSTDVTSFPELPHRSLLCVTCGARWWDLEPQYVSWRGYYQP